MHSPGPPDAIPGEPMVLVTERSDLSNEAKEPMHLSASARMPYQKGFVNVFDVFVLGWKLLKALHI